MYDHQMNFHRILFLLATALLAMTLTGRMTHATLVDAVSYGSDMVGADVSVLFAQSGQKVATVDGAGAASLPGFFEFSVPGATWEVYWQLKNTTSFDTILSVQIDLSNTTSPGTSVNPGPHTPGVLFDTRSGTPHGSQGVRGVRGANTNRPPFVVSSFESIPWADPMNTGDLFVREDIIFDQFGPGRRVRWRDDTDTVGWEVPEPSSAWLLMLAGYGWRRLIRCN